MVESLEIKKMHEKPPYGIIAILFIGAFVAILNNTLLNIALPVIMEEFSITPSAVQWLTTGYMLVNGIMIPASAFFIQKFTNRRIFITAMVLFSLGTFIAIIAPTFSLLVVARMIQASGSALMMPLLMNVMLTAFPIEKRGAALGMFGLVMFTAPAIGPTLSGWVVENYSWRTLFEIVLPISLLTLALAIFKLKNITPNRDVRINFFSLVLSTLGFGGLLYGFSSAGEKGWNSPIVYGTIALGTVALVLFIVRQLRMKEPMLDFRIYKYPMFALASVVSMVLSVAMFSGMILTPLYVQNVRGISPLDAGLLMLPGAVLMGIMSPITGRLFDKYGPRILVYTGLTISVIGTYLMSQLQMDTGYYYLMAVYTFRMFGLSMVMMPVMTNGMNSLPMISNPHGTAMNNTLQQVSGAIGSALLLTLMTKRLDVSAAAQVKDLAASGVDVSTMKEEIGRLAMLDGVNHAFFISTVITFVALILSLFIKRVMPPTSPTIGEVKEQSEK
ncbi:MULTISPECIES: DHA2 family efflux MFS transporter permease subunit [unclassified Sporosarcina]|uniref:DHA2 family efflux MFS transporter permease subunit n=1 Tax=unclassified Sporosarcina TaxID=2647733 RepID=UPI000C16405D|nr:MULTISPECIES: DHA2 family efflux MFS transporter permease subunit [unclassified Sporosarcina]PID04807.1 MFS transporter [Sporosarcina sp. P30]PID07962.1 MFS transporter [Sporosarcina sp. P31]PID11148.1 MFS transporter [Sporosarcina sp. P32b]